MWSMFSYWYRNEKMRQLSLELQRDNERRYYELRRYIYGKLKEADMKTAADVKARIEKAEAELKAAKAELTALEADYKWGTVFQHIDGDLYMLARASDNYGMLVRLADGRPYAEPVRVCTPFYGDAWPQTVSQEVFGKIVDVRFVGKFSVVRHARLTVSDAKFERGNHSFVSTYGIQ